MSASLKGHTNTSDTVGVCFRSLQETAVSSQDVIHAILCGAVEFCKPQSATQIVLSQLDQNLPPNANIIGLSGRDGSVKQKTSANASAVPWNFSGSVLRTRSSTTLLVMLMQVDVMKAGSSSAVKAFSASSTRASSAGFVVDPTGCLAASIPAGGTSTDSLTSAFAYSNAFNALHALR